MGQDIALGIENIGVAFQLLGTLGESGDLLANE
jgi:hypothetical protein